MGEVSGVRTRRALLQALGTAFPVAAGLTLARSAFGFSREQMPAAVAKAFRDHCAADAVHAPTLEAAFARLDAAGIEYDRAEIAATLRCPICGCSIISCRETPDGAERGPPSF
jgi:Fe-S oxidoreductase